MLNLIVIRLYPAEQTTAEDFTNYLNGLAITGYDFSFNQIDGEQIGQAKYLPYNWQNSRISQHFSFKPSEGGPQLGFYAVATAVIELPPDQTEYRFSDLRFKIERNGKEIINRSVHYNVPLVSVDSVPQPVIPHPAEPISDPYRRLDPVSIYLPLPEPGRELDPTVGYVDLPEDGAPPNFAPLKAAVEKVLAADPGIPTDLTQLTPKQCKHIAYEIVWNRELEPSPVLKRSLEAMYTDPGATTDDTEGKVERDRKRFEAEFYSYYATHNAKADQLSKYIYSISAALFCEQQNVQATQVRFAFPVRLTATDDTAKIKEAEVMLSNP
jgi:hypothetical protein